MAFHKNTRIGFVGLLLVAVIFGVSFFKKNSTVDPYVTPYDSMDSIEEPPSTLPDGDDAPEEISFEEPLLAQKSRSAALSVQSDGVSGLSMPVPTDNPGIPRPDEETKVIRSGNISMRVNDAQRATQDIENLAQNLGGDVLNSNFSKSAGNITDGYLTVMVPSDKFTEAFENIKSIGSIVTHNSINTQDVTEEFIDLEAQLKNKKLQEEKMRSYLDRAEDIDDLLKVEQQLSRVRGEVERLEGRLKYLNNKTDFATITIALTEDSSVLPSSDTWRPLQDAKDAFNALVQRSQNLASAAIVFLISRLPFIILTLVVIIILYRVMKKVMKRFGA